MLADIDIPAAPERWRLRHADRYCYLGGSSSSHQVQTNEINPKQFQQYQDNYSTAKNAASTLTPYTGQITAGFNPTQIQSQGILSDLAMDPRYAANNNTAIGAVNGVLGNPQTASQLATTDLKPYLNPYTDQVVDTTLGDLSHARDQQQVKDNASATAARAFGGTRQSVLNANTTDDYLRNVASTTAGLRSSAFTNAQGAAATDVAAQNNMKQFNTNAQLTGANELSSLNRDALGTATTQGGILSAIGDTQQAQLQRELTDAYNAYTQGQNLTLSQQQLLNQALGIIPIQQTTTSDGTTKSNPGMGGILGGIASLGLAAATGGTSLGLTGALGGLSGILGGALKGQSSGPSMGWT